jgi:RNA polymerase sigma factor (sigma-70 family)
MTISRVQITERDMARVHRAVRVYCASHAMRLDDGDLIGAGYEAMMEAAARGVRIGPQQIMWAIGIAAKRQNPHFTQRGRQLAQVIYPDATPELWDAIPDKAQNSPAKEAMRNEQRRRLDAALMVLPEKERAMVIGHYFLGLQYKTLGEYVGHGAHSVQRIVARALTRMRMAMA